MDKSGPRIKPVVLDNATPEQAELLGDWSHLVLSRVYVNHPDMYRVFMPVIKQVIRDTKLPPRDRQIVVLRILSLCDETYEMHHHHVISRNAGMSEEEISAACAGKGDCLCPFDLLLVRAAEELFQNQTISDATWQELAAKYSQEQLMEVVFLSGTYVTMAMTTKCFGIPLESEEDVQRINALRDYT